MLSRRTLFLLGVVALAATWWRLSRRPGVVVLGSPANAAAIGAAVRELDGAARGRVDTVDLSHPYQLRIVVRAPAARHSNPDNEHGRARVDKIVMEMHAHLTWSRLTEFRRLSAMDTVVVTQHRETLWPTGLPGMGREWRSYVFANPLDRGWSWSWRRSLASAR